MYEFKEDISINTVEGDLKLRKCALFTWVIIIPLLIVAIVVFGSLYMIERRKLREENGTAQPSGHHDLSICKKK